MQITERDIGLLVWINSHGIVTISHIAKHCKITEKVAYRRMRKLCQQGLVLHNRYFYNEQGIYCVSPVGVALSNDTLPSLRRLAIGTLRHDLLVTTVSQRLSEMHSGLFITERQLRHNLGLHGVGQSQHITDGELHLYDKKIGIEVELTHKSQARLNSIINRHLSNFEIDEVWYFCKTGSVLTRLQKLVGNSRVIKIHDLDEFLTTSPNCSINHVA